jgi:hypothetical protein
MRKTTIRRLLSLAVIGAVTSLELTLEVAAAHELAGTSWKLVKLQAGDETTSIPDDGSKYTITFGAEDEDWRGTWRLDDTEASAYLGTKIESGLCTD